MEIKTYEVDGWDMALSAMRKILDIDHTDSGYGCCSEYCPHHCSVCESGHLETCEDAYKDYIIGEKDAFCLVELKRTSTPDFNFVLSWINAIGRLDATESFYRELCGEFEINFASKLFHLSYKTLSQIYHTKCTSRSPEWAHFCEWIRSLPNAELIVM